MTVVLTGSNLTLGSLLCHRVPMRARIRAIQDDRPAAEADIAPGDSACMTMRWLAAAEGTLICTA